ncbi:hypothetical protein SAMN05428985_102160 [Nocardioides sp. YR527]|uniref:hypothetical protein n=1 Tax=Nocardioides sp. YR527 TaxID=1881028 RepID=UPI00088E469F|nr:hypothetical protein [Nocardioides sp. YR527]SDJ98957.1 hypothetical protein SAMN05428985_102160 [Nocardioides sp. YR527]
MNAVIVAVELAAAAAFLSIPIVRHRYGAHAMAGAEAELARQGVRTTALREYGMRFDASGHEWWAPGGIAALLVTAAGLTLAGFDWMQPVNVVVLSLLFLGNCVIVYSNLTATRSVQAAFRRKNDPELAGVDVPALLKVAEAGFPDWTWTLQKVRNTIVFAGSALGLILLAVA